MVNLWIHDDRFSKDQVVVNLDHFPGISPLDLVRISTDQNEKQANWCIVQIPEHVDQDLIQRNPQLQISLAQQIAVVFKFQSRSEVFVQKIESQAVELDYVELTFRDQYIGRSDMWRLKQEMIGKCIYCTKRLVTLGIRAQVRELTMNGELVVSGIASESTKFIFRSESAKLFIFVQMSKEMWEFDEDGDLFSEKAVYGFLTELFFKWKETNSNHVVSIILFSRIKFNSIENDDVLDFEKKVEKITHKDYYRVVIDWETRQDWSQILIPLRNEFNQFRRHIMQEMEASSGMQGFISPASEGNVLEAMNLAMNPLDKHYIDRDLMRTGLSIAIVTPGTGFFKVEKKLLRITTQRMIENGIGLDLICLSKPPLHTVPLFQFISAEPPFVEFDSKNSESQSLSVSPSRTIERTFQAIDPLYYDPKRSTLTNSVERMYSNLPSWIELSFWNRRDSEKFSKSKFDPRCKMYQVQNVGIFEGIESNLVIEPFKNDPLYLKDPSIQNSLSNVDFEKYDDLVFSQLRKNKAFSEFGDSKHGTNFSTSPESRSDTLRSADFDRLIRGKATTSSYGKLSDLLKTFTADDSSQETGYLKRSIKPMSASYKPENSFKHSVKFSAFDQVHDISFSNQDLSKSSSPLQVGSLRREYISSGSFPEKSGESFKISASMDKLNSKQSPGKILMHSKGHRQNYINPCNPAKNVLKPTSHARRWQHVFSKSNSVGVYSGGVVYATVYSNEFGMNWKSLCAPACLPLTTDYFPTNEELTESFKEYMYTVGITDEVFPYQNEQFKQVDQKLQALLTELVNQRLAQGFQMVTKEVALEKKEEDSGLSNPYLLSMPEQFHKVYFDSAGKNVQVRRYVRKIHYNAQDIMYKCAIWTQGSEFYQEKSVKFVFPQTKDYNWNYLDHLLSGYQDEMTDATKFWRTRFLLIPAEITNNPLMNQVSDDVFDEEELRLAAFKRFIDLFDRVKWQPQHEKKQKSNINIEFTTLNTSSFVQEELLAEKTMKRKMSIVSEDQSLCKSTGFAVIASAMQDPITGVELKNRRWHLKMYEKTFIGAECVDWMLKLFKDIETREEAVQFGNILLQNRVFEHVNNQHSFLDGHYFYRLSQEQEVKNQKQTDEPKKTTLVELSRRMIIDLDLQKKSNRNEIAFLHYDTIHNPKNCYHFQIHWLVCTARLIEDLLASWQRQAEKCGLKLVEAPVVQSSSSADDSPFQSMYSIPLAFYPQSDQNDNCWFEHELIKSFGFVLDLERDSAFPQGSTSWSFEKTEFKYTQYVHKSGTAFVQVLEKGSGFLWVNNRLLLASANYGPLKSSQMTSPDALRVQFTLLCSNHDELVNLYNTLVLNKVS